MAPPLSRWRRVCKELFLRVVLLVRVPIFLQVRWVFKLAEHLIVFRDPDDDTFHNIYQRTRWFSGFSPLFQCSPRTSFIRPVGNDRNGGGNQNLLTARLDRLELQLADLGTVDALGAEFVFPHRLSR